MRRISIDEEVRYRMRRAYAHPFSADEFKLEGNQAIARIENGLFSIQDSTDSRLRGPYQKKVDIFMKEIRDAGGEDLKINFAFQESWNSASPSPCFSHSRRRGAENVILWPHTLTQNFASWSYAFDIIRDDCAWSKKTDTAVWRGNSSNAGIRIAGKANRIDLMERHFNSKDVDVGFSKIMPEEQYVTDPNKYYKGVLSRKEQLRHKYLIVVEGNDCASSMPWALYSRSLVLMPIPSIESIATFGLRAWEHYVPLADDFSDLEERMKWCREHDAECWRMARNATRLISRLFRSGRERKIKKEILRIYRQNCK